LGAHVGQSIPRAGRTMVGWWKPQRFQNPAPVVLCLGDYLVIFDYRDVCARTHTHKGVCSLVELELKSLRVSEDRPCAENEVMGLPESSCKRLKLEEEVTQEHTPWGGGREAGV